MPVEIEDQLTKKRWKSKLCVGSLPLQLYTGIITYRHIPRAFVSKLVTAVGFRYIVDVINGHRIRLTLSENNHIVLCYLTLRKKVDFKLKVILERGSGKGSRIRFSLLDFLYSQGINLNQVALRSKYACCLLRHGGRRAKIDTSRTIRSSLNVKTTIPATQANRIKHRITSDTSANALYYSSYDWLHLVDAYMDRLVLRREYAPVTSMGSRMVGTWSISLLNSVYYVLKKSFPLQDPLKGAPRIKRKHISYLVYVQQARKATMACKNPFFINTLMSMDRALNEMTLAMMDIISEMINLNPLAQYLDQTNILAEYVHTLKLSLKFLDVHGSSPGSSLRDIQVSSFGRFCPLFTVDGVKAGTIHQYAHGARSQPGGGIQALLQVINPIQPHEEKFCLLNAMELNCHSICVHPPIWRRSEFSYFPRFVVHEQNEFRTREMSKVYIFSPHSGAFLAPQVNLTPFLLHDDPGRCLMGSHMQRQAVVTLSNQKSMVSTGMEATLASLNGNSVSSLTEGIVTYVASNHLTIRDMFNREIYYFFPVTNGNQREARYYYPVVWEGERVFPGQLLVETQGVHDGELGLGQNLLLAYASWYGYNYEDAILMNERVTHERTLTSVSLDQQELFLRPRDTLTRYLPGTSPKDACVLNRLGLASIGSTIYPNTVMVGKIAKVYKSLIPPGDLTWSDSPIGFLYGRIHLAGKKRLVSANYAWTGSKHFCGVLLYLGLLAMKESSLYLQEWPILRCILGKFRPVEVGDKLCGRHGNKGVVSALWPQADFPYTLEGLVPDLLVSPLGVPSRMNLGQILETLLGLTGLFLDSRWKVRVESGHSSGIKYKRNLIYHKLQTVKDYSSYKTLFNPYYPGKTLFRDGRTGHLIVGGSVLGVSYLFKLIHMVHDKVQVRSQGVYSELTLQPIRGRIKGGGQRFGEMEVWALEAFGAAYELRDLLTLKSDSVTCRRAVYTLGRLDREIYFYHIDWPEAWYMMVKHLNALGIEINR